MKLRPYLTFSGECQEALDLYQEAFNAELLQVMRFGDLPPNPAFPPMPEQFKSLILQATMQFGDEFIRLSDCAPNSPLNDPESERLSIAVEATEAEVRHAFEVLAREGRVGMPLAAAFYSPCAGVVFDKFGVMWNFVAQK